MAAHRDGLELERIPEHMHGGVIRYIEHGIRPGHFLTALFSNDLMEAFGRADDVNTAAMRNWVLYIYNHVPVGCHGSPERVAEWIKRGGLAGLDKRELQPEPMQ